MADKRFGKSRKTELSLKERALNYLSRREYSRSELRSKLMFFSKDLDEIDNLLDLLERDKFLSMDRFVQSVLHRRAGWGGAYVLAELEQHQVAPSTISVLTEELRQVEFIRAHAVWLKKFGASAKTSKARSRQIRFLAGRGFSHSVIAKIMRDVVFLEDDFS
ncbi:recombination regulator RecX [Candidatus Pandoraea novymonadis]|uniref:Regulatory protein RecX n=1 Tax=Candidatus Pandoraea novymonadis TaxID=1808959 RepID=A0ABX5FF74_9BURK|nr:recombination regulator RecX [Candidatus Pandoraea novymonadis]PSB92358.1 Regulatory protein RecX [Candidatus Pandoraea novymonadis]